MSGVAKGIKKVFKKVGKVLKKIIKPLAIAVAVYFTAGIALAAMPATAGFAASMPGFAGGGFLGTGIGASAAAGGTVTAGTGIFSTAAQAIGLGGGLAGATAEAAGTALASGMGVAEAAQLYGTAAVTTAQTSSIMGSVGSSMGMSGAAVAGAAGMPTAAGSMGTAAGMSLADKLLLTKVGTDVAGALFGPSEKEIAEMEAIEASKFRGSFYGMDASGGTAPPPPEDPQAQAPLQAGGERGAVTPEQQQLDDGRAAKTELFPTSKSVPVPQSGMATGPGVMHQQLPVPSNVAAPAPNVRYV